MPSTPFAETQFVPDQQLPNQAARECYQIGIERPSTLESGWAWDAQWRTSNTPARLRPKLAQSVE